MFKKIKLLIFYINTIRKNINNINKYFAENKTSYTITKISYDYVYRLYTVLNFPPNTAENVKKYGYHYLDNETRKFISDLNKKLKEYGLLELVGLSKADQLNENSIHIVVEFKFLKTTKIARNIILTILLLILSSLFIIL